MNEIRIFNSAEFGEVRTVLVDGEPMFCLSDICTILGLSNATMTANRLEEDEVAKLDLGGKVGLTLFVNESGLYAVILRSDKPNAKTFRKWVTGEVLPSIRKTGNYALSGDALILAAMDELHRRLEQKDETIKQLETEVEHKEDVIIGLVDDISLADKRQILNRVVRYKGADFRERWRLLYREFNEKYHINVSKRVENYNRKNGKRYSKIDYIDKHMGKIPELYEIACKLFENDIKALVAEMYDCAA